MNNDTSPKLAVLIDADNASADIVEALLEEIAKYGIASVKRIYGDWSSGLKKWKNALLPHAITPVQQFAYTKGKNATDMALVIDAMDLLYSDTFDGFCLVSSDSDFTRLASRLRENGLTVYGFGEKKTPEAFRKACDKFIYTEIFQSQPKGEPKAAPARGRRANKEADSAVAAPVEVGKIDTALLNLLYKAVKESADDLGWAGLGAVGSYVNKVTPDFDARNYGFAKLSSLIKSLEQFETQVDNNQLKIRKTKAENGKKAAVSGSPAVAEAVAPSAEQAPRRRGRPPKNNVAAPAAAPAAEPTPAKGKRGRPAKNSNAAAETAATTQTAKAKSTAKTTAKSGSGKRGRPAKKAANTGHSFGRLIPLVQQAVAAAAGDNSEGWARLGDVVKQLKQADAAFTPQQYGFDDAREAIHGIYSDWLEIQKIGRGERVRINKRYAVRENTPPTPVPLETEAETETALVAEAPVQDVVPEADSNNAE
ncbi:hypothetical protein L1281_001553 [Neisseria sp. HSC-16F19]|nr:NYN domain-containing protein [Neisseria sp. HSC-16F19]MCP2040963.1 hypothetical protein [Neisseria sp. HSC-16F19]